MRATSGGVDSGVVGLFVGLGILAAAAMLIGLAVGPATAQAATDPAFAQSDIDPDAVVMRVDVQENGNARWTVDFRVRLDDENATEAFLSVKSDVEQNASAFTREFASGMRRTVRSAENRTGRSMALRNVTVSAHNETLPQLYGVVTYRFTWTNFATTEGDRIRAGDALADLFLDRESTLIVSWPERYERTTVSPEPTEFRDHAAVWRGPLDFGPGEPDIVVQRTSGLPLALLAAAAVVLVVAIAGGWGLYTGRLGGRRAESGEGGGAASEAANGGAAAEETAAEPAGAADSASESEDDAPPEELLSNEEKVLRLLDEEGGRIKQQQIAGEFDWTDAKTSQVVGKLRDEGEVETFRIGRENVVALPEE
ncbi:MAG: helix-turn-helix transcriptional regulator, partial [Haloarculaceae archaeon]